MVRRFLFSTFALVASITAFSQTEVTDTLRLLQPDNGIPDIEIKQCDYIGNDSINSLDEKGVEYRYRYDAASFQDPQLRDYRISVPDISFYNGTAPIFTWKSGTVVAIGGSVSYPGLMQVDHGSIGVKQSAGPFSFYIGATSNKYGWYKRLQTQYGINGSIDCQLTPWMSLSAYGTYYWGKAPGMANMMPLPPSMLGYYGYNKFGGYIDFHNERFGIQMGGQLVKGTYNSRYEVEPIATPYVKVGRGKKKIGIGLPVGQIIYGMFGR